MTITYNGTTGGASGGAGSISLAYASSPSAGDLQVVVLSSGDTGDSTPTVSDGDMTLEATGANSDGTFGDSTGPRRSTIYTLDMDGAESGSFTASHTMDTGSVIAGNGLHFSKTESAWDLQGVGGDYSGTGSSIDVPFASVDLAVDDVVVVLVSGPLDGSAFSSPAFSASGITFSAVTTVTDAGSTTGNDVRVGRFYATVTAGSGTGTVNFTSTDTQSVGGALLRLRESSGAATVNLGLASETDTALGVTPTAGGATVDVGLASEASTALPVTAAAGAATVEVGVATEADTALGVTPGSGAVTVEVGVASTADTALPVTAVAGAVSVPIGIAAETSTALPVTGEGGDGAQLVAVGIATETGFALPVVPVGTAAPGTMTFAGAMRTVALHAQQQRQALRRGPDRHSCGRAWRHADGRLYCPWCGCFGPR